MLQVKDPGFIDTIMALRASGFDSRLALNGEDLICPGLLASLHYYDVHILQMHYFPDDNQGYCEKMVYALNIPLYCIRGVLVITGISNNIVFLQLMSRKQQKCFSGEAIEQAIETYDNNNDILFNF